MEIIACCFCAALFLLLFWIWGRGFLYLLRVKQNACDSILFGFFLHFFSFQIFYLPFFIARGSFRILAMIWSIAELLITLYFLFLSAHFSKQERVLKREKAYQEEKKYLQYRRLLWVAVAVLFIGMTLLIVLHPPSYGSDARFYIEQMNRHFYSDTLYIRGETLDYHHGLTSFFTFFTIPAFLGIRPIYLSLYTVRIIGVVLANLIVYRIGREIFEDDENNSFSTKAAGLALLVSFLLLCWGNMYISDFFVMRIYEAKGYCQFVLLPMCFSILLSMFRRKNEWKLLWKELFLVSASAVTISVSSMTALPVLLIFGMTGLLFYDSKGQRFLIIRNSAICILPNLFYIMLYLMLGKGFFIANV